MHEGHHGILDEMKKTNQGGSKDPKHDHPSDHEHSHGSPKDKSTTVVKILAGIIVAIAIVGVLIWKMQS